MKWYDTNYSFNGVVKRTDKFLKDYTMYNKMVEKVGKKNVYLDWTMIDNEECGNEIPTERMLVSYSLKIANVEKQNNEKCKWCGYECDCLDVLDVQSETMWIMYKSDLGYKRGGE